MSINTNFTQEQSHRNFEVRKDRETTIAQRSENDYQRLLDLHQAVFNANREEDGFTIESMRRFDEKKVTHFDEEKSKTAGTEKKMGGSPGIVGGSPRKRARCIEEKEGEEKKVEPPLANRKPVARNLLADFEPVILEPLQKKVRHEKEQGGSSKIDEEALKGDQSIFNTTNIPLDIDEYGEKVEQEETNKISKNINNLWRNEKEIDDFLRKVSYDFSNSSVNRLNGYQTLCHVLFPPASYIKAPSDSYVKVTKKEGRIPVGLGIKKELGIFAHLKQPCGQGNFKQAFSANWIKPTGEIQPVVYKKLNKQKDDDQILRRVQKAERELKLQSSFNHPSIVKLYSYDIYGDSRKIAIYEEACDGDLKSLPVKNESKWSVAIEIADAIIYLHARGYSHNDIKLNNIFLKGCQGKLADFGHCNTIGSLYFGYKRIEAPEQRSGQPIGNDKTDIYQFGLCLWHLFHPNPPHGHINSHYIYPCTQGDQEGLLHMFKEWNCDELHNKCMMELVRECLDPNPQRRPSMATVKVKLLKIQELAMSSM